MRREPLLWTTAALSAFLAMCRQGVPRDLIAERLGWSGRQVQTLDRYLRDRGCQPYPLPLSRTYRRSPLRGREEEIARLSREGHSKTQIAKKIGVSRNAVAGFMWRNDLYAPQRKQKRAKTDRAPTDMKSRSASEFSSDELEAGAALARMVDT